MFDLVKKWMWYDWALLLLRLVTSLSLMLSVAQAHERIALPLGIVLFWAAAAFSVPWFLLQLRHDVYLLAELAISGGLGLYLTSQLPEAYLAWLVPAFMIAANSTGHSYRWSAPVTAVLIPLLLGAVSPGVSEGVVILQTGLAYAMGFAFYLLVVNHRQSEAMRRQHAILEQYLSRMERLTREEERSRMAEELHGALGRAYTPVFLGLEALRPEVVSPAGTDKLDSLLTAAGAGFEALREVVCGLEPEHEARSLSEALRQAAADFGASAGVQVRFGEFGEAYAVPRPTETALQRCLQESLTNASRHGQATDISAALVFEERQIRLDVQDNGRGTEQWKEGFGVKAMKERAAELGGQVTVYVAPGQGAMVSCTLPRRPETLRVAHQGGAWNAQDVSGLLFGRLETQPGAEYAAAGNAFAGPGEAYGRPGTTYDGPKANSDASPKETGARKEAADMPKEAAGTACGLTPREQEILLLLAQGLRYKSIALKLYLSDGTVRNYASSVYAKLGVRNREEAIQRAAAVGLLPKP